VVECETLDPFVDLTIRSVLYFKFELDIVGQGAGVLGLSKSLKSVVKMFHPKSLG
jgi:hypothetical protein